MLALLGSMYAGTASSDSGVLVPYIENLTTLVARTDVAELRSVDMCSKPGVQL
jgi:hypothetical protein